MRHQQVRIRAPYGLQPLRGWNLGIKSDACQTSHWPAYQELLTVQNKNTATTLYAKEEATDCEAPRTLVILKIAYTMIPST